MAEDRNHGILEAQTEAAPAAGLVSIPEGLPVARENAAAPGAVVHLLPSLTDVAFLIPVIALFARLDGAKYLLGDGDTGWHVRTGEWILANGRIPHADIFSFTKPGQPWFAWEWLWDLAFGWMHQHWGLAAVVLVSTALLGVVFAAVYRLTLWKCNNPLVAIAVTTLACLGSCVHWLARPHLWSWIFLIAFLVILEAAQTGRKRLLLWLPVLTAVWTNVHGGFVAGIGLVITWAIGEWIAAGVEADPEARLLAMARAKRYAVTALACLAASLLNPYGYQLHVHIVQYLFDPFQYANIEEFLSLNFQHPMGKYIALSVLLGGAAAAWSVYRRRFPYALTLTAGAYLALVSVRNVPIYLLLAAGPVAWFLQEMLDRLPAADVAARVRDAAVHTKAFAAELGVMERIWRVPVVPVATMFVLGLLFRAQVGERFRAEYDHKRYPTQLIDTLKAPEYSRGVFADDEWGDYLVYRLYPYGFKDFVDGRSDFYGAKFDEAYIDTIRCKWNWESLFDKYRIHTVILPVDAPLAGILKQTARWRVVHDDHVAIMFRRISAGRSGVGASVTGTQVPAVTDGGLTAAARPPTLQPVVYAPQSYARRN